jgi:hypothetical protein
VYEEGGGKVGVRVKEGGGEGESLLVNEQVMGRMKKRNGIAPSQTKRRHGTLINHCYIVCTQRSLHC